MNRKAILAMAMLALVVAAAVSASYLLAPSNIDPANKFSWGENIGWMNWYDADGSNQGVLVGTNFLTGYIWAENAGWIDVGGGAGPYANTTGLDFGVNILGGGDLDGYAWGENIGWINFGWAASTANADRARFDSAAGRFRGWAWGENIGWVNLDDSTHYVASTVTTPPLEDVGDVFPNDTSKVDKNRFLSVVIPAGAAGQELAIRVEMVSMAAAPAGPGTPSGRQFRYVTGFGGGADFDCVGSINFGQNYNCGQLVCSDSGMPIYRDWGDMAGEVLHITGDAVHAGSQYAASLIPQSCGDTASADSCAGSEELVLNTAVWGDHADSGGDPLALDGTANVIDISFAVDKVKDLATALPEPRIWKKDADPDPNGADINVLDAAFTVDAVKSLPYPASFVITTCP